MIVKSFIEIFKKKKFWSKLPNAKHIDWVLESMRSNTNIWIQAYDQDWEQARAQVWDQARNQASGLARLHVWKQAREQAWEQAYVQARDQAINQVWSQAWDKVCSQALYQVSGVLLALIAYDDCEKYLSMTYNELKTWALVSENPQAILLLPLVYVKEQFNECLV